MMAAALGPPEVIAQLENAAKVLMVSAPRPVPAPAPPGPVAPAWEPPRGGGGAAPWSPSRRPAPTPSWGCARPGRVRRERGSRPRRPPDPPHPGRLQSRAGRAPLRLGAGGHGRPANHPPRCEPSSPGLSLRPPPRGNRSGSTWKGVFGTKVTGPDFGRCAPWVARSLHSDPTDAFTQGAGV